MLNGGSTSGLAAGSSPWGPQRAAAVPTMDAVVESDDIYGDATGGRTSSTWGLAGAATRSAGGAPSATPRKFRGIVRGDFSDSYIREPDGTAGLRRSSHSDIESCADDKNVRYEVWLFMCQCYALGYKEVLRRIRRPCILLSEVLAPALITLVVVYMALQSPAVWVAPHASNRSIITTGVQVEQRAPTDFSISLTGPLVETDLDPWKQNLVNFSLQAHIIDYANAMMHRLGIPPYELGNSIAREMWMAGIPNPEWTTLFSDPFAAGTYKIPTFDEYVATINNLKAHIGNGRHKFAASGNSFLQFITNHGPLAIVADSPAVAVRDHVARFIDYMLASGQHFAGKLLCRRNLSRSHEAPRGSRCVFSSVAAVQAEVALRQQTLGTRIPPLWAIVVVHEWDPESAQLSYDITLSKDVLPEDGAIEAFPQGLGKSHGLFAYNGYLTLQYELNEFFTTQAAVVVQGGTAPQVSDTVELQADLPFVNSLCNHVERDGEAFLADNFPSPTDPRQQAKVSETLLLDSVLWDGESTYGAFVTVDEPCGREIATMCVNKTGDELRSCLKKYQVLDTVEFSDSCDVALRVWDHAECRRDNCASMPLEDVIGGTPGRLRECVDMASESCSKETYVARIKATEAIRECSRVIYERCPMHPLAPGCREERLSEVTKECAAFIEALDMCDDEFHTICPLYSLETENISFDASLCLSAHINLLSKECSNSELVRIIIAPLFRKAVGSFYMPPAQQFCLAAHPLYASFHRAIAVEAFPTEGYTQSTLMRAGSQFIGFAVAVAYLIPFASQVLIIGTEREKMQHMYLIIIGVRQSAIMAIHFIIAFVESIVAALLVCLVLRLTAPQTNIDGIFSLLFVYGLSLSSLSQLAGTMAGSSVMAVFTSSAIFFLFLLPSMMDGPHHSLGGLETLFAPAVLARAVESQTRRAQMGGIVDSGPSIVEKAYWTMFGLTALYELLAVILVQLEIPNSYLYLAWDKYVGKGNSLTYLYVKVIHRLRRTRPCVWLGWGPASSKHRQRTNAEENREAVELHYLTDQQQRRERSRSDTPLDSMYEPFAPALRTSPRRNFITECNIGGVGIVGGGDRTDGGGQVTAGTVSGAHADGAGAFVRALSASLHANTTPSAGDPLSVSTAAAGGGVESESPFPASWVAALSLRNVRIQLLSHLGRRSLFRNVSMDLYQDKLNCVIGEAGSGKSVLGMLLFGWIEGMRGCVRFYGRDQSDFPREDMGVCLQEDVAWDYLTPSENIFLVQLLKGHVVDACSRLDELNTLLTVLQLDDMRNLPMKHAGRSCARRLSVAMAFAGGARVVVLDEPTAGVDAVSRRAMWQLLSQNAQGRCIVAMTSDLEELEAHADAVTFLYNGQVRATGTPDYIKRAHGGGWLVTVCRSHQTRSEHIVRGVLSSVPTVTLVSNVGQEMAFHVPSHEAGRLPQLLSNLELMGMSKDISGIAVSDARLDELFVRLTRLLQTSDSPLALFDGVEEPLDDDDAADGADGNYTNASRIKPRTHEPSEHGSSRAENLEPPTELLLSANPIGTVMEFEARADHHILVTWWRCVTATFYARLEQATSNVHETTAFFIMALLFVAIQGNMMYLSLGTWRNPVQPLTNWAIQYDESSIYTVDFSGNESMYQLYAVDGTTFPGVKGIIQSTAPLVGSQAKWHSSWDLSEFLRGRPGKEERSSHRYGALALNSPFLRLRSGTDPPSSVRGWKRSGWRGASDGDLSGSSSSDESGSGGGSSSSDGWANMDGYMWNADVVLYNSSFPLSLPAFVQVASLLRLRSMINASRGDIIGSFGPATLAELYGSSAATSDMSDSSNRANTVVLLLPFIFFASLMAHQLVEDRVSGFLSIKLSSALAPAAYWLGNFAWDFVVFQIFSFISLIIYSSNAVEVFANAEQFWFTWAVALLFSCSAISLTYVITRFFRCPSSAQSFVIHFHIITGPVFFAVISSVRSLPPVYITSRAVNEFLAVILRFMPAYAFAEGLSSIATLPMLTEEGIALRVQSSVETSTLQMLTFPLFLASLILYDSLFAVDAAVAMRKFICRPLARLRRRVLATLRRKLCHSEPYAPYLGDDKPPSDDPHVLPFWQGVGDEYSGRDGASATPPSEEDPSVAAERTKGIMSDGIQACEVWKQYDDGPYVVRSVALNVSNEVCSVIGLSGSGKSTLLKCLWGEELPSYGNVYVGSVCLTATSPDRLRALSRVGFVPDRPAVNPNLSPYAHLNLIATYRMLPENEHRLNHILFLLRTLGLERCMHAPCWQLSPSLLHSVTIAMALVGYPPVLIMDEPTSMMSPLGKRQLWAAVKSYPRQMSLVMSTQSPDDVEMLGDRLLILDGGRVRYIGDVTEMKRAQSLGVTVTISVCRPKSTALSTLHSAAPAAATTDGEPQSLRESYYYSKAQKELLVTFFHATWPLSKLVEESPTTFVFRIPVRSDEAVALMSPRAGPRSALSPTAGGAAAEPNDNQVRRVWTPVSGAPHSTDGSVQIMVLNTIRTVFETVHHGRESGWAVSSSFSGLTETAQDGSGAMRSGERERDAVKSVYEIREATVPLGLRFDCSITVSEMTFRDVMAQSLAERTDVARTSRELLNMNCRLAIREYPK